MRHAICWAVFGLLFSSGTLFSQPHGVSRPSARPRVKVVAVRGFIPRPAVFLPYCMPVTVPYPVQYPDPVPYPVWNFIPSSPAYVFVGSASPSHPQLVFKDGTTYTVTDYWRVNDRLNFITTEEGGTKSVPHTAPFEDLDVQRTTDANTGLGFRFVLRQEPIEQWLEHHRQHAPRRHRNNTIG